MKRRLAWWARAIRDMRTQQGLTQTELARRAGLSRKYVGELETGHAVAPSVDVLERLLKELGAELEIMDEAASEDDARPNGG